MTNLLPWLLVVGAIAACPKGEFEARKKQRLAVRFWRFTKLQNVAQRSGEMKKKHDILGILGFTCCMIFWGSILEMKLSTFWWDLL